MDQHSLLLSPADAAQLLGCGRTYLYRLLKTGELRAIHLGRLRKIPRAEVEAYIDRKLDAEPAPVA